ncbi:MAG TPA: DUF1080 domain-containing protein [Opitutaceae bacterium]|nr:DUF1080 domain-containing protein [Opitutaceae bacterium]
MKPHRNVLHPRAAIAIIAGIAAVTLGVAGLNAESSAAQTSAAPRQAARVAGVPLFNGHDITGWTVVLSDHAVDPRSVWSVAGGVLRLTGAPKGYLRTEQSYSNYRLHVEWRWPADAAPRSNSGVFVHVHGPDVIWPAGIECQLASGNAGQLVATDVDLPGAPIINKKARAAKLAASSEKPHGEWNSYDIVCRGTSVDVTVNGVHQNHVDHISVEEGHIGLQMEGYPIEFRNVWLQSL